MVKPKIKHIDMNMGLYHIGGEILMYSFQDRGECSSLVDYGNITYLWATEIKLKNCCYLLMSHIQDHY